MNIYFVGSEYLSLPILQELTDQNHRIALSAEAIKKLNNCRNFLDKKLAEKTESVYGINTGFGYLQKVIIANDQLTLLQHNLLLSHACGTGEPVQKEITN